MGTRELLKLKDLVEKAQATRDLLDMVGVKPKHLSPMRLKSAVKTGFGALVREGSGHQRKQSKMGTPGNDALRSLGYTIIGERGERAAPTSQSRAPGSRPDFMEMIVRTMKQVYSPGCVNVATWDAALDLDVAKCCGLQECGTVASETGFKYRFAVFRGVGQIKWRGGMPTGVPDLGFAGNASMGPDSIWFGNTDEAPHNNVSDLKELMTA